MKDHTTRAITMALYAHHQHAPENFDHAVNVARRVSGDPRADSIHIAAAYLMSIGRNAQVHGPELIRAGVDSAVVRAVGALEMRPNELFLDYLRRVSENHDTALVAYHDFEERYQTMPNDESLEICQRLRRAADNLNEAVNLNTPRSG